MTEFLQVTAGVLTLACVYALLAFGWNVIYAVTGVLNLAQGEFFMIGAIVAAMNVERGAAVAVALGLTAPVVVAVLTETALLRPLARRGRLLSQVVVTLAVAMLLRESVAWIVGPDAYYGPEVVPGVASVELFGAFLLPQAILLWILTAVAGAVLWYMFARSTLGIAMRACAESPDGAATIGLSLPRLRAAAFAVAGGLGALAGVLTAALTPVAYNTGTFIGLKGFVAAAIGGLGVLGGAFVGAVLLAALEGYFAAYVSDAYRDVLVFAVLIVLLMVRPSGIMGGGRFRRRTPKVKDGDAGGSRSADPAAAAADAGANQRP